MPRMQNAVDGGRANTTVNSNVVFGDFAGATLNGAAVGNVFIGNRAGQNVSSGSSNTFVGTSINQGGGNPSAAVAIGVNAMFAGGDHINCIAIGNGAGAAYTSGKVGNIALGGGSQPQMTDSNFCVGIGYFAQGNPLAFGNFSTGDGNIAIGANSQLYLASGIGNTHLGTSSGGAGAISAGLTGNYNVGIGYQSQSSLESSVGSVCVGYQSGLSETASAHMVSIGYEAGKSYVTSSDGTYVGYQAGMSDVNQFNTFIGSGSGKTTSSGHDNVAVGYLSLNQNVSGSFNTMVGDTAGQKNTADYGTFVGIGAGREHTSGINNTFIGNASGLNNLTGANNCYLGGSSGTAHVSSESDNIMIMNIGVAADAGVIRIGTAGTQTSAFVSGITGVTVTGVAVLVDANDQLGVAVSSAKFKENVNNMDSLSEVLYKLRPVTFNYKKDESQSICVGLIAEEVEEVYSNLVAYDKTGQPMSVKYQDLVPLLLNEIQKLNKRVITLERK